MRKILSIVASIFLLTPSLGWADSLGSATGGQAAPQSNMGGGLCLTSPKVLTNGQQAGLLIDCTTHALITSQASGGGPISVNITQVGGNAVTTSVPVSIIGGAGYPGIRVISTGASDFATVADFPVLCCHAIFWNSSTATAKAEHLPACNAGLSGGIGIIQDEIGTAGTLAITITPNGSDTINLSANYIMAFNQQSVTIQCNGAGNWVLQ